MSSAAIPLGRATAFTAKGLAGSALKLLPKNIADYISGKAIGKLPDSVIFRNLDPTAESSKLLAAQAALRKLTLGLSDRPNFHVQDRVVGGLGGSVLGAGTDQVARDHDGSLADVLGRVAATAGGGWLGGKSLNELGNVGRRYIANSADLYGYGSQSLKPTLKSLYEQGWKNKTNDRKGEFLATLNDNLSGMLHPELAHGARREYYAGITRDELLRRYLGIFKSDAAKDLFVKMPDGSLQFNKRVVTPKSEAFDYMVKKPWNRQAPNVDMEQPARYSAEDPITNIYADFFGSHDTERIAPLVELSKRYSKRVLQDQMPTAVKPSTKLMRGRYRINDAWNFAIDPTEPDIGHYLKALAKTSPARWKEFLAKKPHLTHPSFEDIGARESIGGRLASVTQRVLMEKLLRQHTPVVLQDMDVTFVPRHRTATMRSPQFTDFKLV